MGKENKKGLGRQIIKRIANSRIVKRLYEESNQHKTEKIRLEQANADLEESQRTLERTKNRYSDQFQHNQELSSLLNEQAITIRAQNSEIDALKAISNKRFRKTLEAVSAYISKKGRERVGLTIDRKGKIITPPQMSKESQSRLGYNPEVLPGLLITHLMHTEDYATFQQAVEQSRTDSGIKGFRLDIGLKKYNKQLTPYTLTANIERSTEKPEEVQAITLVLEKRNIETSTHYRDSVQIDIRSKLKGHELRTLGEQLNSAAEKAKEGKAYRINFIGTQNPPGPIISRTGNLLVSGPHVTITGLSKISDEAYTALRSRELGIPRERLGLRNPVMIGKRTKPYEQEVFPVI